MYPFVLTLHSWVRWLALAFGIVATLAVMTDAQIGPGSRAQRRGLLFMMLLDIQMLLGLTLYFALSPYTRQALQDFGAAMKQPGLRFWAVEHLTMMMLAVVLAHAGRIFMRKAKTPDAARMRTAACFALAVVLMLLGMPWRGTPLFRF